MFKKYIYIIILALLATSCSGTFDSVKRGLTGAKGDSADEFLVKEKDPLILPPDFENLPTPNEKIDIKDEVTNFEKNLEISDEANSSTLSPVENSILKKIQTK